MATLADITIGTSEILNDKPKFLLDGTELEADPRDPPAMVRHYEALIRQHGRHPYLLVRLGILIDSLGCRGVALALLEEAQAEIAGNLDIDDPEFNNLIEQWESTLQDEGREAIQMSSSGTLPIFQRWRPTKDHRFPVSTTHSHKPHKIENKQIREPLFLPGSPVFRRYLIDLAIETNQVENVFFLTKESIQDLTWKGIKEGKIETHPRSRLTDRLIIQNVLNDTIAAYDDLFSFIVSKDPLTPEFICDIHARLMDTSRFTEGSYIPPGQTRTTTRKTVFINTGGDGIVQCAPYFAVEGELERICQVSREYQESSRDKINPFAFASWLHLILARCHPFNDGNGRTTRLISSIPLLKNGYPPISISLSSRNEYFAAINQTYEGNHGRMIECFFDGMDMGIENAGDVA